jgi:hypothetical protein
MFYIYKKVDIHFNVYPLFINFYPGREILYKYFLYLQKKIDRMDFIKIVKYN